MSPHVLSWDFDFEGGVAAYGEHASGLERCVLVDRSAGAVHTDLALSKLGSGGFVDTHVHSFERCVYVLGGAPILHLDGEAYQLEPGHFVLFPVGTPHGWRNEGSEEARLVEVSSPQPASLDAGELDDTFFLEGPARKRPARAPDPADPTVRLIGRYLGTPPQAEALGLDGPARGREPAGMDSALLAYSGISIKMLVDPGLGADLLTMFTVDYEPEGAAQVHDHPFEECYLFLEGEIEAEIQGRQQVFHAGELLFCGVGELHGFFNTSGRRVRWIETQAPQPPARHSYRWPAHWERLRQRLAREAPSEPPERPT